MKALRWHDLGFDVSLDGTLLVCRCQQCDEHIVFGAAFDEGLVEDALQVHITEAHPETVKKSAREGA